MKEELSDFLKTAYKYNKIKESNEAFEEYRVEEDDFYNWIKSVKEVKLDYTKL